MKLQITQATITTKCRERGDIQAINIALDEIKEKMIRTMKASVNDNATFQIIATVER